MGKQRLKVLCWKSCCLQTPHRAPGWAHNGFNAPLIPPSQSRGLLLHSQLDSSLDNYPLPTEVSSCSFNWMLFFASSFEKKPMVSIIGTEVAAAAGRGIQVSLKRCYLISLTGVCICCLPLWVQLPAHSQALLLILKLVLQELEQFSTLQVWSCVVLSSLSSHWREWEQR